VHLNFNKKKKKRKEKKEKQYKNKTKRTKIFHFINRHLILAINNQRDSLLIVVECQLPVRTLSRIE
jgi:hypothetical protein